MTDFVIDNSVVCGWILDGQANNYSDAIGELLKTHRAAAPTLLRLEYTNVLRTACKRQKLMAAQAYEVLSIIDSLPIDIDISPPEPGSILDIALRYELTSYDAAYLDLALRRRLPIATLDEQLAVAAKAAGVGLVNAG